MECPEFTVENIEKAVYQLYYDPSPVIKDTAQRWLTIAQRSKEAWSFAWELLQPDKGVEVQYFGASALVTKISISWDEVPENEIERLRDRLFSEILRLCVSMQDRIVLTRVCIAFSGFIMKCMVMDKWITAVTDIMTKLQDCDETSDPGPMQRCAALLEILTVLAEEYHTKVIDHQQKAIIKYHLNQGVSQVTSLLLNLLKSEEFKNMRTKVLGCFSSWMAIGIPLDKNVEFVNLAISCLNDPELFDNSVECLLQVFCLTDPHQYKTTIKQLVPKILALRPMLCQAIEDKDSEMIMGITKVVCGLAENHSKMILENYSDPEVGVGLMSMVFQCTTVPLQYPTEEDSSAISFTFWYSLQDEFKSLPPEVEAKLDPEIQSIYIRLIEALVIKARYPADESHKSWSSDEVEQHRVYRIDVSDTLMFVLEMLGSNMIAFLCGRFAETVTSKGGSCWQDVESLLFAIHSLVETTYEWDQGLDCLHTVARLLPIIELNNDILADTVLSAIGAMSDWLVYSPQYLPAFVAMVLGCLDNPKLSLTSVLTLKRITRECNMHLKFHASAILSSAQSALVKGTLKNSEVSWLLQSVGHVLSILPEDECINQLESVLMLHMHQLQALTLDPPSGPTKNSILHILDILKSLFSTLDRSEFEKGGQGDDGTQSSLNTNVKQPVLLILEQITPILQKLLTKWASDGDVVAAICTMYERSMKNILEGFSPLISTLCEMLIGIFQAVPHIPILNLTQQLTLIFGRDEEFEYPIGLLLRAIIDTCRRMYEGGHAGKHPDLAQAFMELLSHILKKNNDLFFKEIPGEPSLPPFDLNLLFHCGLATISLPESESAKTASSFFLGLYKCSTLSKLKCVLDQNCKMLYLTVMKCIAGQSPRTVMDNMSDILYFLAKAHPQEFNHWLQESRDTSDFPLPNLDSKSREVFFFGLSRSTSNMRKMKELVIDFSLVCRGLHGMNYAS